MRFFFGVRECGECRLEAQADALPTLCARIISVHQGGPNYEGGFPLFDRATVAPCLEAGVELTEGVVEGQRVDRKVDRFRRQTRPGWAQEP